MTPKSDSPGCRNATISVALLVVTAVVFMVLGLTLVNDTNCSGVCETSGFTLLYAGLPISALFGVLFGDLVVAWPLDITLWVVLGFLIARWSDRKKRNVLGPSLMVIVLALAYGLVLSQFVELAI
ncbi:MAG TPA: hypothetical protein VFP42_00375 [Acidimicrobiia bacterium]|nr:hypothetical protein [Acidimicrobiia bacterium]